MSGKKVKLKRKLEQVKKRRDLRLLWNTNGIQTNSGYAVEARDLLYRLVEDGWPVAVSAFHGIDAYPVDTLYPKNLNPRFDGLQIKQYPSMGNPYGSDAMFFHGNNYKAHVVMSLQDIWTLDPQFLSKLPTWIPWLPIDKEPIPINVIDKMRYAYKIMCFSKFGNDLLLENGFSPTFIYEGTDTEIFKPMNQQECRKQLGLPQDAFFFCMVAANKENPPRKGYQEALTAFKMFHDKHPEAAILFHTQQKAPTGFPIKEYAAHLGVANRMWFVDDYTSMFNSASDVIAKEYNACDALLHPSQTEGFGLTIIEAEACGLPVVIQNCQSMPELIIEGKTGFGAETLYKRYTSDLSFVNMADPQSVYECMEKVYKMVKENENKVKIDCRNWVVENFNIDTLVKTKWVPFLESLQDELLPIAQLTKTPGVATMVQAG